MLRSELLDFFFENTARKNTFFVAGFGHEIKSTIVCGLGANLFFEKANKKIVHEVFKKEEEG
jgi:hypothetical protein